jgi:hypothetical protein
MLMSFPPENQFVPTEAARSAALMSAAGREDADETARMARSAFFPSSPNSKARIESASSGGNGEAKCLIHHEKKNRESPNAATMTEG